MEILKKYALPLVPILSLVIIYACMFSDKSATFSPFLYLDSEVRERYYFYTIGTYLSYAVLCFVIALISRKQLRWSSVIVMLYWIVITLDFICFYNTTNKAYYWPVIAVLFVAGLFYNDKRGIRKRGTGASHRS